MICFLWLTCTNIYFSKPFQLIFQQQCFIKPSDLLHHICYLVTKHLVWFQTWRSPHEKVYIKFCFCFNEGLKWSVVLWFQSNLNLTLDLPYIIIKKLPVYLESGYLKFVKKFITPQDSIPVKNLNTMLLPTNLAKSITLRLHWSTSYL